MKANYINTDLVLCSDAPFDDLVAYFEDKAEVLWYAKWEDEQWRARVNAADSGYVDDPASSPERDIQAMVVAIESMSGSARDLWTRCAQRELNIGWQSGASYPEGTFELSNTLLQRVAEQGMFLSVTIYPPVEEDPG